MKLQCIKLPGDCWSCRTDITLFYITDVPEFLRQWLTRNR